MPFLIFGAVALIPAALPTIGERRNDDHAKLKLASGLAIRASAEAAS